MKNFIAIAVIFAVIITAVNISSCNSNDSSAKASSGNDSLKKVLERGEYLANHVSACIDCHSKRDFNLYSGPPVPGTEGGGGFLFDEKLGLPGKIFARNITPDNETGIGTWTDEEILRAMTQGISKNGDTLFPIMPYAAYNRMARQDLLSIIAYIKTLKPIRNKIQPRRLMMPIAAAYPGPALQPSVDGNTLPPASDAVRYGEYLVMIADCGTCHSPLTPQGPDKSREFAGGYTFKLPGFQVVSANITSDTATGIGAWTQEQFVHKFAQYREEKSYSFNPGKNNTVMPISLFAGMKDDDLKAVFAYLKTIRPIVNKVEKYPAN